ncbi:MAG: hypothetical protein ACXWFI_13035 [Methylobacter sp.]
MNTTRTASTPLPIVTGNASVPNITTMHGDTSSSDTTHFAGPASPFTSTYQNLATTCSTILIRSDGNPMILGTTFAEVFKTKTVFPVVMVLDKDTGEVLSKPPLTIDSSSLLGGVYAYLDGEDRLWMVSGTTIVYIEADPSTWRLTLTEYAELGPYLTLDGDGIVSLSPDIDGDIWFVSAYGVVGICNHQSRQSCTIQLGPNETVNNSFSTATVIDDQTGSSTAIASIASNYALYLFRKNAEGRPEVQWRLSYDRGTMLKPGQLGYPIPGEKINTGFGTGATPTFFGPTTGAEYVTITDNSDEDFSVLVVNVATGALVCQQAIFPEGSQGTENSAIGINNTVVVASTYGYPYPVPPFFNPSEYPFYGGLVRVDFDENSGQKRIVWQNMDVRSAAVPKLSLADGLIYTVTRRGESMAAAPEDSYYFTAIDFYTGDVVSELEISHPGRFFNPLYLLHNPLQMAGNFNEEGVFWQGSMGGVFRISKSS